MTFGIFPARTTSAAMCVTPSTISVDAPKVGVSPKSATATSRRSRWWSIIYVSKLYDASRIARRETGAAPERARAVIRHPEQGDPRLVILRDGVREARRSHGRTEIACAYLRTTPLNWTRACVGRALRRT